MKRMALTNLEKRRPKNTKRAPPLSVRFPSPALTPNSSVVAMSTPSSFPPLQKHPGPREPKLAEDFGDCQPPAPGVDFAPGADAVSCCGDNHGYDEWSYSAADFSVAGGGGGEGKDNDTFASSSASSVVSDKKQSSPRSKKSGHKKKSKVSSRSSKKKSQGRGKDTKSRAVSSSTGHSAENVSIPGAFATQPIIPEEGEDDENSDYNTVSDYTYSNQYNNSNHDDDYDVEGAYFDNEVFEDEENLSNDHHDEQDGPSVLLKATLVADDNDKDEEDHVSALTQATTTPMELPIVAEVLQKIPEEYDEVEEKARQRRQRTWGIALIVAVALLGAAIVFLVATRNNGGSSSGGGSGENQGVSSLVTSSYSGDSFEMENDDDD